MRLTVISSCGVYTAAVRHVRGTELRGGLGQRRSVLLRRQHFTTATSPHRQVIAGNIPYDKARCLFKLTSLSERRDSLCSKLFRQLVSQSHILHGLLPAQRDGGLTGLLRPRNKYPTVRARTNRLKNSFIPYAIDNIINNICSI